MKIQSLAVMFIILILPIAVILGNYTQNRVETLSLQAQYDSKLKDATYDALKAYQINSFNSDSSMIVNSKMRDIKASVNTFFNSLGTNFATIGYTKETLQSYVPAVVYTMYDGYYIYAPYKNTWDDETRNKGTMSSYNDGESLYGLKPYINYSCRYKKGTNLDIVITYALDNYITIQGMINGKSVSQSGYLLSNVENSGSNVKYNGIEILQENSPITENVYANGEIRSYQCIRKNGVKYYIEGPTSNSKVFSVIQGQKVYQNNVNSNDFVVKSAQEYYKDALNLKNFIINNLSDLKVSNAVDINGQSFETSPYQLLNNQNIFDYGNAEGIEEKNSNFNTHRIDVIKYSIERNLSVAISNYNNFSGVSANFQMPKLKDIDWDKIMDNISIISFLQGMSIGGKMYNGYTVITNNENEDVVMEDSIYIRTGNSNDNYTFHRFTEKNLENNLNTATGIFNVDIERRTNSEATKYYYPLQGTLSYDSIVTQNNVESYTSLKTYFANKPNLAKIYYTALGRERYSIYRPKLEMNM